jgi:hypothetical protein
MTKAIAAENWKPGLLTTFVPTQELLLRVCEVGWRERVAEGEYAGHVFDPAKKGDPVFLQAKGSKGVEKWRYGTRATPPSAPILKVDVGVEDLVAVSRTAYAVTLWRIPYAWRAAAAKLAGRTFASREEVEAEMRNAS